MANNALLSSIGFTLAAYSIYVEHKIEHDDGEDFDALCDIEAINASCSAVFSLPEGKMMSFFGLVPEGHPLDVPNGVLGVIFYVYTFIRHFLGTKTRRTTVLFDGVANMIIASLAMGSSIFLGRKLWVIKELCVVCLSTHVINSTIWIRSFMETAAGNGKKNVKIQ